MPDRVLRNELLTSERYWAVSIEAQRLYVHLILVADDTARFSGKNYTIRTACFPGQPVAAEKIESLLGELLDKDLVRIYHHNNERYIFIPRYRQRMRYPRSKYPPPPQQINDIPLEKTDLSQSQDGPKSAEVKRSEEKRRKASAPTGAPAVASVWDLGVSLLREQGVTETGARGFLGSLLREWEEPVVEEAVRSAVGKVNARAYIAGVLKTKPKKAGADSLLAELRAQHGDGVKKTPNGYDYPARGMRWNKDGEPQVSA